MSYDQGFNDAGEPLREFYVKHNPVDLSCPPEEGMTRQEFAADCDINLIMERYQTTGVMDAFLMRDPLYLDVSNVPDLASALQLLDLAQEAFMRLPAATRREFDNDAVKFVQFAENPANLSKMREWGLAPPEKPAGASGAASSVPSSPPVENAPAGTTTAPSRA